MNCVGFGLILHVEAFVSMLCASVRGWGHSVENLKHGNGGIDAGIPGGASQLDDPGGVSEFI